jgi:hypothetical protein
MQYISQIFFVLLSFSTFQLWAAENPAVLALRSIATESLILREDDFWHDANHENLLATHTNTKDCKPEDALNRWTVWSISKYSIKLLLCGSDHVVKFQIYPDDQKGYLAILNSIDGNHGQTQDFEFFLIDDQYRFLMKRTENQLGIAEVHWNDFIDTNKFNSSENYSANMYIDDDGSIVFYPWTWMDPRWDNRKVTNRIYYTWNGSKFRRHTVKLDKEAEAY